jgi:hypothetical protein
MSKRRAPTRPGRRQPRRRSNRWPWLIAVAGVLLLVGIPVGVNAYQEAQLPGERFRSQGNVHVQLGANTPAYNSEPPTSGWHTPHLASWGTHLERPPADQELVHNMEDGGVILWYRAGTREENLERAAALEEVVGSRWPRTVIVPREALETPFVLTAWTRLQRFDELDVAGKRAFLEAFHGIDHHRRF